MRTDPRKSGALLAFGLVMLAHTTAAQEVKLRIDLPPGEEGGLYSAYGVVDALPFSGTVDLERMSRLFIVTKDHLFQEVPANSLAAGGARIRPLAFQDQELPAALTRFTLSPVTASTETYVTPTQWGDAVRNVEMETEEVTRAGTAFLAGLAAQDSIGASGDRARYELIPVCKKIIDQKVQTVLTYKTWARIMLVNWQVRDMRTAQVVLDKDIFGGHYIGTWKIHPDRFIQEFKEEENYANKKAFVSSLQCLLSDPELRKAIAGGAKTSDSAAGRPLVVTGTNTEYAGNVQQDLASVVTVRSGDRMGSAFFVTAEGHLLTNAHVLQEGDSVVSLVLNNGFKVTAHVVRRDATVDVALLKMDGATVVPLKCDRTSRPPGAEVYAIGTPASAGLAQSLTKGIISGNRTFDDKTYIQTDVAINKGNSGGPLVDEHGTVLGIITAKLTGPGMEGLGFAIPIERAFSALGLE